jgi:hypothetical protein
MTLRRRTLLGALPFVLGAAALAAPTAMAADPPSPNASCVAQLVKTAGAPGLFESQEHQPMFGLRVSFIATLDRTECLL